MLAVIVLSSTATIGVLGWLGIPLDGLSSAEPAVLLDLAFATGVHTILAWQDALTRGGSQRGAGVLT